MGVINCVSVSCNHVRGEMPGEQAWCDRSAGCVRVRHRLQEVPLQVRTMYLYWVINSFSYYGRNYLIGYLKLTGKTLHWRGSCWFD